MKKISIEDIKTIKELAKVHNYDEIYKKLGFRAANVCLDVSDKYPNTKKYTPINFEDLLTWFNENC